MKKIILILLFVFGLACTAYAGKPVPNWKSWETYPDTPRLSASMVTKLFQAGENVYLIYTGFQVQNIVCGSVYLPYSWVPPYADGSQVDLADIPKDALLACY